MDNLFQRALEYRILPGKPDARFPHLDLYNRTYTFWKGFWTKVLKDNGTEHVPNPDDFIRQTYLSLLVRPKVDEVVALHAYTLFDLHQISAREHSYFAHYFTPKYMQALTHRGARFVMSMEYFSVARDWRAPNLGLSLAGVLLSLGIEVARTLQLDAIVGVARTDLGVEKMTQKFGAVSLDTGLNYHNTPCDLVAFFKEDFCDHPDPRVTKLAAHFWENRVDLSSGMAQPGIRVAA